MVTKGQMQVTKGQMQWFGMTKRMLDLGKQYQIVLVSPESLFARLNELGLATLDYCIACSFTSTASSRVLTSRTQLTPNLQTVHIRDCTTRVYAIEQLVLHSRERLATRDYIGVGGGRASVLPIFSCISPFW